MKYLLLSLAFVMFLTNTAAAEIYYHGHHQGYYRQDSCADGQSSQAQNDKRQPRCSDNGYCRF